MLHSAFLVVLMITVVSSPALSQSTGIQKKDSLEIFSLAGKARQLLSKPNPQEADIVKAEDIIKQALQRSEKLTFKKGEGKSLLLLSSVFKARKDENRGRATLERAVITFRSDSLLKEDEADACMELAGYYPITDAKSLEKKIGLYEYAVKLLYKAVPKSIKLANSLKYLGDLYNVKDDNVTSIERLQAAVSVYKTIKYDKLQDIYCLLGAVLNRTGASREGLKYLLLAEKAALRYNDSSATVATLYNRLGNVYNSLNQLQEANKALRKSLIYARHNHDTEAILIVSANLGWSYIRIDKPEKAILTLKEALKDEKLLDTAHRISLNTTLMEAYIIKHDAANALKCNDAIKNMIGQFYLYDFLIINYHRAAAKLFLMTRNFEECQRQVDATVAITKNGSVSDMASIENILYKLDSARNRPWDALNHLNRYKLLSDSLNRRNHDRELSQMQIEYETEKKDLDIASLQQRSKLQERALGSEKLVRNLSVAGMLLFVLFTAVLFASYRLKQKSNRELQNKQNAINAQNLSLRHLLTEREWLIKEVHHRVKNNFQIVISLLDSQSSFLLDENALDVLRESRHRMHSISLVHQKLYQDKNLTGINIKGYITELIGFLKESFSTGTRIRFDCNIPDLLFDVSQVVPLGLIINEAITNSIKYAFKNQTDCVISINMEETNDHLIGLSIKDNGCGLPSDFNLDTCATLGMNLISGLTRQLQGELSFSVSDGLTILISFERLKTLGSRSASADSDIII
ncbi:histidine kinase dimerization/phosphoacceptor domain -containing protein [Mucilaginibacter lutimaris]|uniref:histidine kinase n=1 Tax=Mucilaginibacter lutimaris TaxID=931629 RepID=A0ABW2ZEJ1_9SPHI